VAAVISFNAQLASAEEPAIVRCAMEAPLPSCMVWGVGSDVFSSLSNSSFMTEENVQYSEVAGQEIPVVQSLAECMTLARSMVSESVERQTAAGRQVIRVEEALVSYRDDSQGLKVSASMTPRGVLVRSVNSLVYGDVAAMVESNEQEVSEALVAINATKQVRVKGKFKNKSKLDKIVVRASGVFARN
ncbi:MAG: hypothetical protein AAB425_08540, partial [Bdellovibrionota bacterium]